MKRNKVFNALKKIFLSGNILAVLTGTFYLISIIIVIDTNSVDFDIYANVDIEKDLVVYKFKKLSDDKNKNYKARLYYVVSFPVEGELKQGILTSYNSSLVSQNGEQFFVFECPYSVMEQSFSQMASITYYIDNNLDTLPKTTAYLNVSYSIKHLNIKRDIWYSVEDGNIERYYPDKDFKNLIENHGNNINNTILIYCNNNNVVDPEYIQRNIELCNSYDELLRTVNSSEDRELTESEKAHLKDTFVKNGDVLQ